MSNISRHDDKTLGQSPTACPEAFCQVVFDFQDFFGFDVDLGKSAWADLWNGRHATGACT